MKKFQSLVILFLALLLAVSVPAQAFAATAGDTVHEHTFIYSRSVSSADFNSHAHWYVQLLIYVCTVCNQETTVNGPSTSYSPHSLSNKIYTGRNFHVEGTETHRAEYKQTCFGCGYANIELVSYHCRGVGQHIVPNALRPILSDK